MARLFWGGFFFFMAWFFWLFNCLGAEAYTWRDVLQAKADAEKNGSQDCSYWVKEYDPAGSGSYRLYSRCTWRGTNGVKSTVSLYEFPSGGAVPTNYPLHYPPPSKLRCNFTGQSDLMQTGDSYRGGGAHQYQSSDQTYIFVPGPMRQGSRTLDCLGAMAGGTTETTGGYIGSSATCPVSQTDSGRNCVAMDQLETDFGAIDGDDCPVTSLSVGVNSANELFKVHTCNCIPRRYGETRLVDLASNTCESVRITGDPAFPAGMVNHPGSGVGSDPTTGVQRVAGEPGTGGAESPGGTNVPPGPRGGGGDGTTVPVWGAGGGAVPVTGTGTGGAVKVEGTGEGGSVKTSTKKELDEEAANVPLPGLPGTGDMDGGVDSIKPAEQDWGELVTDFLANSVPLISAIRGSGVQTSGELCRLEASFMGHTIPFDFCPLESVLQAFGVFVVGIASLYSLLIIAGRA